MDFQARRPHPGRFGGTGSEDHYTGYGEVMELLSAGRDADVYALGDHRVRRRYRHGYGPQMVETEARLMAYLRDSGYPTPEVFEFTDTDLVMSRVHGPTLLEIAATKPWRIREVAATMTRLLDALHEIEAPQWLRPHGSTQTRQAQGPARVLHMDLHPGNVMLTEQGPMVIDWTCAVAGNPDLDTAKTYVILACADIPVEGWQRWPTQWGRALMLRQLRSGWGSGVEGRLAAATQDRFDSPNTFATEKERLRRHLARRFGMSVTI